MSDAVFDKVLADFSAAARDRVGAIVRERDERAAAAAKFSADNAALRQRIKELEAGGSGLPVLQPGTAAEAGKTYALPAGAAVKYEITVPGVTLIGGHVWPEFKGPLPAIYFRPGADDGRVLGTRFHFPGAADDGRKIDLRPCVRTLAKRTLVSGTTSGDVDGFIEMWPGADGTTLENHVAVRGLRSSLSYCQGNNTRILGCAAPDSATENLIRWSPRGADVGRGGVVAWNNLGNPGNKSCIDARHVSDLYVVGNTLLASTEHAAVGIGDKDPGGGDGDHGAVNVWVIGNVILDGRIVIYSGSRRVRVEDNELRWARHGVNQAIYADGNDNRLADLRIRGNWGAPPPGAKPMVGFQGREKIPDLVEERNGWGPRQ